MAVFDLRQYEWIFIKGLMKKFNQLSSIQMLFQEKGIKRKQNKVVNGNSKMKA